MTVAHTRHQLPVPPRRGRPRPIAADAFIGPNVTIAPNTIIAARATVIRNTPPNTIIAGNPGRVVKERADPKLDKAI